MNLRGDVVVDDDDEDEVGDPCPSRPPPSAASPPPPPTPPGDTFAFEYSATRFSKKFVFCDVMCHKIYMI